jgi:hypothetical protein
MLWLDAMKVLTAAVLIAGSLFGAEYPGPEWLPHSQAGWSQTMLKAARDFTMTKQTSAVVIVQGGRVVDQWGDVAGKIETHPSARVSSAHCMESTWPKAALILPKPWRT